MVANVPRLCLFRHYDHDVLYYTHDKDWLRLMVPYTPLYLGKFLSLMLHTRHTYDLVIKSGQKTQESLFLVWRLQLSSLTVEHLIACTCSSLLIATMKKLASLSGLLSICSAGYLSTVSPEWVWQWYHPTNVKGIHHNTYIAEHPMHDY